MDDIFSEIHHEHVNLLGKSRNEQAADSLVQEAQNLLRRMRSAGLKIGDANQRQRLEAYAAHWGSFVFQRTGEYPNTSLEPADVLEIATVDLITLLETALQASLNTLGRAGFDAEVQSVRPELAEQTREARQAAFKAAFCRAIETADGETLRPLLRDADLRKAVIVSLLDPTQGFDLQVLVEQRDEALSPRPLRRFFSALENALTTDAIWGMILDRYQDLRFRQSVTEALQQQGLETSTERLVSVADAQIHGYGAVAQDYSVAAGAKGIAIGTDVLGNVVLNTAPRFIQQTAHQRPSTQDLRQATEQYLMHLVDRHSYLSFKGIGVSDRVPLRIPLVEIYVPLRARTELPEGETWSRPLRLAGRDVDDVEAKTVGQRLSEPMSVLDLLRQCDGLVILGDPGSGKTTFLKYLALRLAKGEGEDIGLDHRLPLLVPLSAYATALTDRDVRLDSFIANYLRDLGSNLPMGDLLSEALEEGRTLVMLDGLDDVPDPRLRHIVVERVVDFYTFHRRAGNKFVLTSRIVGYREVRPVYEGLVECTLVDFDDDEITAFVERWTLTLEHQVAGETAVALANAEREWQELIEAVQRNPGVRRLAANPLLLTILALMKRQNMILPERRVELYDQYIRTMLSSWNRDRGLGRPSTRDLDVVETVRVLAPLALWIHEVSPGVGLVQRGDLQRKLEAIYAERGEENPEAAARQFLADVRDHVGLLLERGTGLFGFIHLTFGEYLAAVGVARLGQRNIQPVVDILAAHVGDPAWWEVSLLVVGYFGIVQQWEQVAGEILQALIEDSPGDPGETAVLVGEAVLDTWPGGVTATCKTRVQETLIVTMQDAATTLRLRRQAGLILGRLGWLPDDLGAFVEICPGPFLYGADRQQREIHYRYWIGRYPVTNAQYTRFVETGGYQKQTYWSEKGWAWRNGSITSLNGIDDQSLHQAHWLFERPPERRDQPFWWDDRHWNNPLSPVIGVCWFEAQAYCNWMTEQLGMMSPKLRTWRNGELGTLVLGLEALAIRLPTEEEWERASRGIDGRIFPWGDKLDLARLNCADAWVGHELDSDDEWMSWAENASELTGTMAVCTFPQSTSADGVWDMAGNSWEWTSTWYDEAGKYRAIRGGSWFAPSGRARCMFRGKATPECWNGDLGFRVVLSMVSPDV